LSSWAELTQPANGGPAGWAGFQGSLSKTGLTVTYSLPSAQASVVRPGELVVAANTPPPVATTSVEAISAAGNSRGRRVRAGRTGTTPVCQGIRPQARGGRLVTAIGCADRVPGRPGKVQPPGFQAIRTAMAT